MVDLPASPYLVDVLRLWEEETLAKPDSPLWRDWVGETHADWHARNKELADQATSGDGDALIELVRRDIIIWLGGVMILATTALGVLMNLS